MDERKLDEAIAQATREEVVGPVARRVDRIERKSSRGIRVAVAVTILGLLLNFLWSGWNSRDIAQNEARVALSEQGISSLRSANEELKRKGLPEIPEPKPGEPFDADALAAAAAAILKNDISDDPQFKGPEGEQGVQGLPGQPCDPSRIECRGPEGKPGENGSQGQQGASGPGPSNDQIEAGVSAYCSADPTRCMGPQGDPGPPGPVGPPGPKIQSFTFEDTLGVMHTCTDPDGDNNYECSASMGG